jgi:uncharacterized protein YjbJ (UPF0337 family)
MTFAISGRHQAIPTKRSEATMMRILTARFRQLRGMLKERWGELIDDPLKVVEGREERLVGMLLGYGYTQEQADRETERFFALDSERKEKTGSVTRRYSCGRG